MSTPQFVESLDADTLSTSDLSISGNFVLKGVSVVAPKSGNKIRIGTVAPGIIVAPSGPLKAVQIIFPKTVQDGQIMFISFTQDVGEVTLTNAKFANKSMIGPAVKAGDSITLFYHKDSDKWYKLAGNVSK